MRRKRARRIALRRASRVQDSVCRRIWVRVLGGADFHFWRRSTPGKSFPTSPKFPMAFAKLTEEELGRIAQEVLAVLHRSDRHPILSTKGLTFADIERAAHALGQRVAAAV